ncbi:putative zinc finger protein [Orchesella cincta]|uniref:RING-type E3 ubiquitin transferase n=1 Tax=Orchesella cincta TaxID=48709 RepID=A0A1D2NI29_ORCCI|nr:putative zinc finger protein [Orchesella cincta]
MSDSACVVCYRDVKYYSVGACDHSVCFECSVRMRVLLEQNECPICRQILDQVIFTRGKRQYKDVKEKLRMYIMIPRYGVYVEDEDIKYGYEALLEHRCSICKNEPPFKDFKELKIHVLRVHDLHSCDLCTEYIKQFSKERRFYSRGDLAYHKRKGDRDDKSHRGHPLCQFCDRRYFDQDELFKHLRKDHFFCHFCDADGYNFYYDTYDDLRIHFRKEHFLCEEEDCKEERFTTVFRTEIDLKAHLTTAHSRLLGKFGTKQARVLDVEFSYGPRSDEERRSRRFRDGPRPQRNRDAMENEDSLFAFESVPAPPPPKPVNTESVQDFPTLEGAAPPTVLPVTSNGTGHSTNSSIAQRLALKSGLNVAASTAAPGRPNWNAKVSGASKLDEEFPALGGSRSYQSSGATSSYSAQGNSTYHHHVKSFTNAAVAPKAPPQHHKPRSQPKQNGFVDEEFPTLGNPSRGVNGSAWTGSGVKMKQVPRSKKVAPAPNLGRKVEVDPSDDFHFVPLSVSRARRDSLSEKFELQDAVGPDSTTNKEKPKKKKKNRDKDDNSNNMPLNAAAIFTGGSLGHVEGGTIRNTEDDFPSLQAVRSSLPTGPARRY